jgi:uridylate kinase
MTEPKYRRVLLKVSGEALAGEKGFGINPPIVNELIKEIKEVHSLGVEVAIVWAWKEHKLTTWECLQLL